MIDRIGVWSIVKTKQDNDMIDRTSGVYVENNIELSWLIGLGAVCDKNQIGQQCDLLYRCGLCRN